MLRYAPLLVAVVAILSVAVFDGIVNHRWSPNTDAEDYSELLEEAKRKDGPLARLGPWIGKDMEVPEEYRDVAGAVGYVNREYVNEETGEVVLVWWIVGPSKAIWRHTPNICLPAAGFKQHTASEQYVFQVDGLPPATFQTASFTHRSGADRRVFWAWHNPEDEGEGIVWIAPEGHGARYEFATVPALFKLYFTTGLVDVDQPLEENVSNGFAKRFLPVAAEIIKSHREKVPAPDDAANLDE